LTTTTIDPADLVPVRELAAWHLYRLVPAGHAIPFSATAPLNWPELNPWKTFLARRDCLRVGALRVAGDAYQPSVPAWTAGDRGDRNILACGRRRGLR